MRKIIVLLSGILLLGCSTTTNLELIENETTPSGLEDKSETATLPAEDELLDEVLQLYDDALDSSSAGNSLAAQNLFERAIISMADIEVESLDVSSEEFEGLLLQLAADYANLLGSMQELPAESSPSAVYLSLSEFLGDSISSSEDLLGLMLPVTEEPQEVDTTSQYQLYPDVPLIVNSYVNNAVKFYSTKGRKVFSKWLDRAEEAMPYYTRILNEEGMPSELVFLAMIESGFSPRAYSRAHASGPWQFISSTARIYGLKVGYWYDERRDLDKSTRAACRYLKKLYDEFDDWYLAFAAYNCGEGRVHRAMRRSGKSDYWGIRRHLPRQTREYVPSMLAARIIGRNPEEYGFNPLVMKEPPTYRREIVEGCVSLKEVSKAAGVSQKVIKNLNPALKRDCTPPDVKQFAVIVPEDARSEFQELITKAPRLERSNWVRHRIRRGEALSTIASKYGVSMRAIMSIPSNNLRNPHKIRAGKYLIIPVGEGRGEPIAEPKVGTPQPLKVTSTSGQVRNIYKVRKGDSLSEIARRHKVRVSDIRSWNNIWGKRYIYPGQKLILWVKQARGATAEQEKIAVGPPAPSAYAKAGNQVYIIQSGDTLWDIAQLYGISVRNLKNWNNIRSVRRLMPGMVLRLQP